MESMESMTFLALIAASRLTAVLVVVTKVSLLGVSIGPVHESCLDTYLEPILLRATGVTTPCRPGLRPLRLESVPIAIVIVSSVPVDVESTAQKTAESHTGRFQNGISRSYAADVREAWWYRRESRS